LKEKIDNCQEICIETIKREYYHQKDTTKPIYKEQIIKIEDICCLEKPFSEA
jgi:hypothetical protein